VIFVDTGAFVARHLRNDPNHPQAYFDRHTAGFELI
jgi:predicted nucleic acid-binding protein